MSNATPTGGWINRITAGTSFAYIDTDEHSQKPSGPNITPRLRRVLEDLYRRHAAGQGVPARAVDIARATGIGLGTVQPLLARLETFCWATSRRVEGAAVRVYELTDVGLEGARDELSGAPSDAPGVPSERVWTLAELERADPSLAAAARRQMARDTRR